MKVLLLLLVLVPSFGSAWPTLPEGSFLWRKQAINIHRQFGINQSSKMMAQLWVESNLKEDAVSWAGARGICQFMPATARGFEKKYPGVLEKWPRYGREWCLRAQALYIRDELSQPFYPEEKLCWNYRIAFEAYNGGRGWLLKERKIAGKNASPDELAAVCREAGRKASACRENKSYAKKIFVAEPRFIKENFPGGPPCS